MTAPRPSLSAVVVKQPPPGIFSWLAGVLLLGFGVGFLVLDYRVAHAAKEQAHTTHLAILSGIAVLGVLVPLGRYVLPVVSQVFVIVGDYLPGGRRRGDPPLPPGGG